MSTVRRQGLADSVRGQGNELLCEVPDRWEGAGGSQPVAAVGCGLAPDAGGVRGAEKTIGRIRCRRRGHDGLATAGETPALRWCFDSTLLHLFNYGVGELRGAGLAADIAGELFPVA